MQILRSTVKRDISLFSVEAWERGYQEWDYPVLFHYDGTRVNFYHTEDHFQHFKTVTTKSLIDDDDLFYARNEKFKKDIEILRDLQGGPKLSLSELSFQIGRVMAFYLFVVSDAFVTARPVAWESRSLSEGILYECDEMIETHFKTLLHERGLSENLSHVLCLSDVEELEKGGFAQGDEIQKRLEGYIFTDSTIITNRSFDEFCVQQDYSLPQVTTNASLSHELRGVVACKGFVRGRVKIIEKKEDLVKIEEGDILVACMTNANYIQGMRKAGAIVTDEGGITCHAAIVSRELGKPCITGTKYATTLFKDGDLVEVDAVRGVIIVLQLT